MKPRTVPAYSAAFEAFWQLYPRRVVKVNAGRAWLAWNCDAIADAVMAGLRDQLPIFARRALEHVPHPATWLNARRWEDEVAKSGAPVAMIAVQAPYAQRCADHEKSSKFRNRRPVDWCPDCREQTARESKRVTTEDDLFGKSPDWMEVAKGGKR